MAGLTQLPQGSTAYQWGLSAPAGPSAPSAQPSSLGDQIGAQVTTLDRMLTTPNAMPPGRMPPVAPNPWREVQSFVGKSMAVVMAPIDMLNQAAASLTFPLAMMLPAFPAVRLFADLTLTVHVHPHPPTFGIPIPAVGPCVAAGACSVLINGLPSARTGDFGLSAWCGGYFPVFEVVTGSSHCMIQGARPARVTDITLHCTKTGGMGAIGVGMMMFSAALGVVGIMAAETDQANAVAGDLAAQAEAAAVEASAAALQLAADCAAMALSVMMGMDPAPPPAIGMFITGSPNVLIGGFPMPGWMVILKGLLKILRLIARAVQLLLPKNSRLGNALCSFTGHPVDVASGRVYTRTSDFELKGPISINFDRLYDSSAVDYNGPLGPGWIHAYDIHLWQDEEQGMVIMRDQEANLIGFADIPPGARTYNPLHHLWLDRLEEGSYRVASPNGLDYLFQAISGHTTNGHGEGRSEARALKLVALSDGSGRRVSLSYDFGRLSRLHDVCGRQLEFGYRLFPSAGHRLTQIDMSIAGSKEVIRLATYAYNEAGLLISAAEADGVPWRYSYEVGLLTREADRNGLSFHFEYKRDSTGARCVHTWGDRGIHDRTLTYLDHATVVRDSLGAETQYEWNDFGAVTKITDAYGATATFGYNDAEQLVTDTDPLGHAVTCEYDLYGYLKVVKDSTGVTVKLDYDPAGRPVHAVDANGGEWNWSYDPAGQLLEYTNPAGERTSFEYRDGLLAAIIGPGGARAEYEYDSRGLPSLLRTPNGITTRYVHDNWGRITEISDNLGNLQRRAYNARGDIVRVEEPDGNVRSFLYDRESNVVRYDDQLKSVQLRYSGFHRLSERAEADATTHFHHDLEGNLIDVVNEDGERYRYVRDLLGRTIEEHDYSGRIWRYQLDLGGQVVNVRKPSGILIGMKYDAAGRLSEIQCSDGTTQRFEYRRDGLMSAAITDTTTVRFELDPIGRVVREEQQDDWVASTYSAAGDRIAKETSRNLKLSIDVSPAGDAKTVLVEARQRKWRMDFLLDEHGAELERRLPGDVTVRTRRDRLSRPELMTVAGTSGVLERQAYEWTFDDRPAAVSASPAGRIQFVRDTRARLSSAIHSSGRIELRLPDAVGNLFETNDRSDRRYARGGQLAEAKSVAYHYDGDGNLIQRTLPDGSTWRYEYTALGLLKRVILANGTSIDFEYDAFGRRVLKQSRTRSVRWIWDGRNPVHELTNDGGDTDWVFEEPDSFVPLARIGREFCSVVADHVGAPTLLVNESGEQRWKGRLDLFGRARQDIVRVPCPWRWPGQYEDEETGLYYNGFRYYDPQTGTFITSDPIGLVGGLNPFAYVADPTCQIDPFGLDWNYRLRDSNNQVYYVGRASDNDTPAGVSYRHSQTTGSDGARFVAGQDTFEVITPPGTSRNTARGVEQLGISPDGYDTAIGRRGTNGNRVRGNNIRGVDPSNPRRKGYMAAGKSLLTRQGVKSVADLHDRGEDDFKQKPKKTC
jgi:RHS repeat-associated protein